MAGGELLTKRHLQAVLEHAPVVVFALDRTGVVTVSMGRGLLPPPEQVTGRAIFEVLADEQWITDCCRRALAGETVSCTGEVGGTCFETHYTPILDDRGALDGVVCVATDVTPHRQALSRQSRQEAVLQYIIASVPYSIFWKDWDGHFLGGNDNFLRDLRMRSLDDLVGKTDNDLGFPKEQVDFFRKCDLDVMNRGAPLLDIEERQDQADGTHTLLTSKVPLRDPAGRVNGMLGIYVDITERKRMEEELRTARDAAQAADRAKGEFLTIISHELRTPLTLILGPLDWMLSRPDHELGEATRTDLARMRRNAGRLLMLVNDLLDFTLLEANRMRLEWESVDVVELVSQLVADAVPAAEKAGLRLKFFGSLDGERVPLDRRKFEKIALNLLGNALKFTPPGGRVDVTLQAVGERWELSVADTGPGIPADKQGLLFQRFQQLDGASTRKHEGSGIGLALVKELAERMGGEVGVESTPGVGSRFFVRLPILPSEADAAAAIPRAMDDEANSDRFAKLRRISQQLPEAPVATPASGKPRILVAEDNADMRGYLAEILAGDYDVELVEDGDGALAAVKARRPAVIVSDLMMPGVDGMELVSRLKADPELRQVPVILLTARATREEMVAGLEGGADDYLAKPFSPAELRARVRAAERLHAVYVELAKKHGELEAAHEQLRATHGQLVHAAKIAAIGTLVAGLSHELNNPLSVILMSTQNLLAACPPDDATTRKALSAIERHTRRCAQLVGTLLDFSRKKPAVRQALSVRLLLERVAAFAEMRARRTELQVSVRVDEAAAPPDAWGTLQELETAILNLVNNALDVSPRGGAVELQARGRSEDGAWGIEIAVSDSGPGIAPEVLPHVFDPFFTTKEVGQGTGLGLSLTRKIVEDHAGRIDVESGAGGTTVRVWLPAPPREKEEVDG